MAKFKLSKAVCPKLLPLCGLGIVITFFVLLFYAPVFWGLPILLIVARTTIATTTVSAQQLSCRCFSQRQL